MKFFQLVEKQAASRHTYGFNVKILYRCIQKIDNVQELSVLVNSRARCSETMWQLVLKRWHTNKIPSNLSTQKSNNISHKSTFSLHTCSHN